jgi:hypothetical protein
MDGSAPVAVRDASRRLANDVELLAYGGSTTTLAEASTRFESAIGPDGLTRHSSSHRESRGSSETETQRDPEDSVPVFVIEGADVNVFGSLDEAIGSIEAIDVYNGEFEAMDARGARIVLTAPSPDGPIGTQTEGLSAEDRYRLEQVIVSFVEWGRARYGREGLTETATLPDMASEILSWKSSRKSSAQPGLMQRFRRLFGRPVE